MISVVVPFYNAEKHIEACIRALLGQTLDARAYEVILVDNNSTDRSVEIVRRHPRVTLLAEPKQGAYAARNRGVAAARGSIVAFTDADCVPAPDWLEKMAAALAAPGVELVQGGRRFGRDSLVLDVAAEYENARVGFYFSTPAVRLAYGYTNNMAVRRELFDRLGPFVEVARGADTLFLRRTVEHRSPAAIRHVPDAVVRHLEITGLRAWLRKRFLYGRSFEKLHQTGRRKVRDHRLTPRERAELLRRTRARLGSSRAQALCLKLLVNSGGFFHLLGRLSAMVVA